MSFFGMGPMEIAVIMVVALIIFGPDKLPQIGAQVGRAVKDFRSATRDLTAEFQDSIDDVQATIGEMKATVTDVRNETAALAASIPASLDVSQAPAGTAATTGQTADSTVPSLATAMPNSNGTTASAGEHAPDVVSVPSKDDPLADFGGMDDDILAAPSTTEG
jgi:sec-independent protein translocase protein TatB